METKSFVIDANIWISLSYNGQAGDFHKLIKELGLIIYRSPDMTIELERVLGYRRISKKLIYPKKYYMDIYFIVTQNIITTPIFTACPNPKDNYLFDLAYQSNADYLVSGDKKDVWNTPITPPLQLISFRQFKSLVNEIY
jgi:putative PIN family toxin of toxin-antitoxin system